MPDFDAIRATAARHWSAINTALAAGLDADGITRVHALMRALLDDVQVEYLKLADQETRQLRAENQALRAALDASWQTNDAMRAERDAELLSALMDTDDGIVH